MTNFGRVFGRKSNASRGSSPSIGWPRDNDGIQRIFSKEMWEGEGSAAQVLRLAGMSPDDPENMLPTQEVVSARMDAKLVQRARWLDAVNAEFPASGQLEPYSMIPWTFWHEGRFASLLILGCKLYPAEKWNTLLLPRDDESSRYHGLPKHPGGYPDAFNQALREKLTAIADHSRMIEDVTTSKVKNRDPKASGFVMARAEMYRSYTETIKRYALGFSAIIFGEDAIERHEQTFGCHLER